MILSTSDIKKQIKGYTIFTIFCLTFGIIYELFSHKVYSVYMYLAFTIPLFALVLTIVLYKLHIKKYKLSNKFLNYSVITLTIGSLVKGALDIYGTTNKLIYIYLIFGIIFMFISIIFHVIYDN